jgi:cold shock protein
MSRGRDFREPRRREFGDDFTKPGRDPYPPMADPRPPQRSGPEIEAVVKWFNAQKGFGFAELSDGSGDAFLHVRAVEAAGYREFEPGTRLTVRVTQGQKGPQVTEITSVDTSTAQPSAPRGGGAGGGYGRPMQGGPSRRPPYGEPRDLGPAQQIAGTVKWYNPAKGFGFIAADDQGKDVFVHRSALARAGVADLQEGQRVQIAVVQSAKGREATSIELIS